MNVDTISKTENVVDIGQIDSIQDDTVLHGVLYIIRLGVLAPFLHILLSCLEVTWLHIRS